MNKCMKGHIPLQLINGANKNDKPIKDLVLSINGDVFSKSTQIIVLAGDIDIRQKGKHKRSINLPACCEHRKSMTIKHRMNNLITW